MNKLQAMRVFVHVVQTGGFKRAAETMLIPKATVSSLIQQLEADLAVKLLLRTTRRLSVTSEGAAYFEHCVRILADLTEVEELISHSRMRPGGRLRVDASSSLAQSVIIPALPEFLDRYPDITLEISCSEREVDLIKEGVDCALRFGALPDSALIARRIGVLSFVTAAAPAYLTQYGRPMHPRDLLTHRCINYFSTENGRSFPWNFIRDDERIELPVTGPVAVNDASSYAGAGIAGLGLVHMPSFLLRPALAEAQLELVLEDWTSSPLPLHAVYPQNRHLSSKVRVFVDWLVELFGRHPEMQNGIQTSTLTASGSKAE